jgi:hypothetical protein
MSQRDPSRRARRAALTRELRVRGESWPDIARRIASDERVNMRVAFRLAHSMTQYDVATYWNKLFPTADGSAGLTAQNISYWETWPQSGREPSVHSYKHLAQIYQCGIGDLIEDGDYSYLDKAAGNLVSSTGQPAVNDDLVASEPEAGDDFPAVSPGALAAGMLPPDPGIPECVILVRGNLSRRIVIDVSAPDADPGVPGSAEEPASADSVLRLVSGNGRGR